MGFSPLPDEAKDYWSHRRRSVNNTSSRSRSSSPQSSSLSHFAGPPLIRKPSYGGSSKSIQSTVSSPLGVGTASGASSPGSASHTGRVAPSAAAAAAFQSSASGTRKPTSHLVPPSASSFESNLSDGNIPLPSIPSTHAVPPSGVGATPAAGAMTTRRSWFRKKSGGPATSLIVNPNESVDDVKIRILEKYPTSLQSRCDPADLVMTVQQSSGVRLELQPDENMIDVIDRYHPGGMKMSDAIEVGPSAMWGPQLSHYYGNPQGATNIPVLPICPSPSNALSGSSINLTVGRNTVPRTALQRARSYSHTQNNAHQLISIGQQSSSSPVDEPSTNPHLLNTGSNGNHASINTNVMSNVSQNSSVAGSERNSPRSPISDHVPSSVSPPSSNSHGHTTPYGSLQQHPSHLHLPAMAQANSHHISSARRTSNTTSNSTSILLLPRQFSGSTGSKSSIESRVGPHATKLVPSTSESSKNDQNVSSWTDEPQQEDDVDGDEKRSRVSASILQSQQQSSPVDGKTAIVPQINVSIVEDNPVNQMSLETFMKRRKVRFDSAKNGREALEKWKVGGFHLILMDIQLPVMTGLEATAEIRRLEVINGIGAFPQGFKDHENPPTEVAPHERISKSTSGFRSPVIIVALTASSDSDDKSEASAAGCNDFLTKPPNFAWSEKKIIEWGCMQALVDYDGWKKWSEDKPKPISRQNSNNPSEPMAVKVG